MTFTNEQLRKFAELGGWTLGDDELWTPPQPADYFISALPDFLHNLPACFDVLERFCGEECYEVRRVDKSSVAWHRGHGYKCQVPMAKRGRWTEAAADTKESAIIAAALAAGGEQ